MRKLGSWFGALLPALLLCAVTQAQERLPGHNQSEPEQVSEPEQLLSRLHRAVDGARFEKAKRLANELLSRNDLSALQRNRALEGLATVQIASRKRKAAEQTLTTLFQRDPQHRRQAADPGPRVQRTFARVSERKHQTVPVEMSAEVSADPFGRTLLKVTLATGADAVATIRARVRSGDEKQVQELVLQRVDETTAQAVLPRRAVRSARRLELQVSARAPSGHVLGNLGDGQQPFVARRPALEEPPNPCPPPEVEPLKYRWWVWTSAAVALAGVIVGVSIAAQ